jgi:ATP-binding cassette subfamily B protein/subfamily B ATP-binding cassette protein MsbA
MVFDLATELFERLQRASLITHYRRPIGDALSRLSGDSYCLYTLASGLLVNPVQQTVTVILTVAVAWRLEPTLTLLTLAVAPLLALSARFFGRRITETAKAGRSTQAGLTSLVHQTIGAMPIVQGFHRGTANLLRFRTAADSAVAVAVRSQLVSGRYGLANTTVLAVGHGAVLFP